MSTDNEQELEAANYVLGNVSDEQRRAFDLRYEQDSHWRSLVVQWRQRLDPLNATTAPVEPPAQVFFRIQREVNRQESLSRIAQQSVSESESIPVSSLSTPLAGWRERVRYWQLATLLAVASLVGMIIIRPELLTPPSTISGDVRTVAVLSSVNDEPLWTINYHAAASPGNSKGVVSVSVVGEPQLTESQSHQLWMVLPEGAGVQSVGLVPNSVGETRSLELPIALMEAAEFAVSLEPLGGVPGPEHGPVVARTFIVQPPERSAL